MLCFPGLTPVAKLAQATGDSEGCVVSSFEEAASSGSFLRFGSLPSSMKRRTSVGSMPSTPITNTFGDADRAGLLALGDPPQRAPAAPTASARPARTARRSEDLFMETIPFAK